MALMVRIKTLILLLVCAGILSNISAVDPSHALSKIAKHHTQTTPSPEGETPLADLSNSAEEEVESGAKHWGMDLLSIAFLPSVKGILHAVDRIYHPSIISLIHRPPAVLI